MRVNETGLSRPIVPGPDPDDLLDQGLTDANGNFKLKVSELNVSLNVVQM